MSRRRRSSWVTDAEDVLRDGLAVLRARIEDARRPDSEVTLGELVRALEGLAGEITTHTAIIPQVDEPRAPRRRRNRGRLDGDP